MEVGPAAAAAAAADPPAPVADAATPAVTSAVPAEPPAPAAVAAVAVTFGEASGPATVHTPTRKSRVAPLPAIAPAAPAFARGDSFAPGSPSPVLGRSASRAGQRLARASTELELGRTESLPSPSDENWIEDDDLMEEVRAREKAKQRFTATLWLAFGSLGIIYGDIGTSPLYVFSSTFSSVPSLSDIYGVTSLIFWSLTIITLFKYVLVVLSADHEGEGGTFALYALLCRYIGVVAARPAVCGRSAAAQEMGQKAAAANAVEPDPRPRLSQPLSQSLSQSAVLEVEAESEAGSSVRGRRPSAVLGGDDDDYHPADDHGSGWDRVPAAFQRLRTPGVASVCRRAFRGSVAAQAVLMLVTLAATGMLMGDGVITPSISVLSAVGGLVNIPGSAGQAVTQNVVVGVACAILVGLFGVQYFGTKTIGNSFAPVILIWLSYNFCIGCYNVSLYGNGSIFKVLNPAYIYYFFVSQTSNGWAMLGGVLLCFTGVEALFADLGHFSQRGIVLSCTLYVYPCLVMTYLGQAAWLTGNNGRLDASGNDVSNANGYTNVFWNSLPGGLINSAGLSYGIAPGVLYSMLVIANVAAVVAAQAIISGCFSIIRQAINLGVFPTLRVKHTDKDIEGQIYIGPINWFLMGLCLLITTVFGLQIGHAVVIIGEPIELANAYGIAVMFTLFLTTFMITLVMLMVWELHPALVACFSCFIFTIEGFFLSAAVFKVPAGGYFSLSIAAFIFLVKLVWWAGGRARGLAIEDKEVQLNALIGPNPDGSLSLFADADGTAPPMELGGAPGLGVYYHNSTRVGVAPPVMVHLLRHAASVHRVSLLITVRVQPIPTVPKNRSVLVRPVPGCPNFYQCVCRHGYNDTVDHGPRFIRLVLALIKRQIGVARVNLANNITTPWSAALCQNGAESAAATAVAAVSALASALNESTVYYVGRTATKVPPHPNWAVHAFRAVVYDTFFVFMEKIAYEQFQAYHIPQDSLVEVLHNVYI